MSEIVFARKSLVTGVARIHDHEVLFLHMPREAFFLELLVASIPTTVDAQLVRTPNSMIFAEVSREFVGKK